MSFGFVHELLHQMPLSATVDDCFHTVASCSAIIATAIELARAKPLFDQSREQFHQFLAVQASIRGLPAIVLLFLPLLTVSGGIGKAAGAPAAHESGAAH